MNIVCIIQARTTSSRLPNKVLLDLPYGSGITVLEQVINRVKKCKYVNNIVVATTDNETDDRIEILCKKIGISCTRGSEDNVLSRYYKAAKESKADMIVRITSDCPCIDPEVIDNLVVKHLEEKNDYTSNSLKRSFPHGLDCEIFSFDLLEEANNNATEKFEKEHVTPYFYKTKKEKYKIGNLVLKNSEGYEKIRITLDSKEDYTLLCLVYDYLYNKEKEIFTCKDIVKLFLEKPWLFNINNNIEQKKVCLNLDEEIEESLRILNKQDLNRAEKYLKEQYYGKDK